VSETSELVKSLLVTGFPYDVHEDVDGKVRLFRAFMGVAQAIRRDGSAALDLCYLAAGRIDGFWEERLNAWDMAAGNLMIEEAGGRVSRYDGSPLALRHDEIVASNGVLHEAMLGMVRADRAALAAPPRA
jgi:myo-inositol-1(or 4)-monophosphatase